MTKPPNCVNWTRDEKQRLIALVHQKKTPQDIAAILQRSVTSVRRQIRLLLPGLARPVRALWTPNEDAQLIMSINDGCPASRIARAMNRSIAAVRNRLKWLRKNGAPVNDSIIKIIDGESGVARRAIEAAITPEDLAWMQHYRQQAAQRQQWRAVA